MKSQRDYFNDAVEGIEPPGQLEGGSRVCTGRLERKTPSGDYEVVWERPLVNDVAPVEVLVANTGNYVVTFDDWYSVGEGPNVVVIYDRAGALVRRFALSDILSPAEIDRLPRSLSSRFWGDGHYIEADETTLVLLIVTEKTQKYLDPNAKFLERRIDLGTGKVLKERAEVIRPPNDEAAVQRPPPVIASAEDTPEEMIRKTGCLACHKFPTVFGGAGGTLGPVLSAKTTAPKRIESPEYIARIKTGKARARTPKEYMIESILDPDAFITPGFELKSSPGASMMPIDYGDKFTYQALDKLTEFLLSLDESVKK